MQAAWAGLDDAAWHVPGAAPSDAGGPPWSLAEHVGHIADWQELAIDYTRRAIETGVWPSDSDYDDGNFDTFNERRREPWASMPRDGILARLEAARSAPPRGRATALPRDDPQRRWVGLGLSGPARPLPRPPRGDRAVDRRTAPARGRRSLMPTAPITPSPNLTIEAIVAVEAPREFRLHPRDRLVAFTAETAGARQLFTLALRGGYPSQLTASEKPVSDPQWSPDGRRLAFVRDDEIWVIEADGSRLTRVVGKPGAGREPRWSPDGHRLAFLSRRRGWSQIWLIDAPVPRRGRPATEPKPPRPTVLTEIGIDVDAFEWAPDGARIAVMARRGPDIEETAQIALVDVATGASRVVAGERSVDVAARWLPDGSFLFVSDADGWFQVVRLSADGHDRIVLTEGRARARRTRWRSGVRATPVAGWQPVRPHRSPRRPPGPPRRRAGRRPPPRNGDAAGRRRRHGPSRRPRPATGSTHGTASGDRSAG